MDRECVRLNGIVHPDTLTDIRRLRKRFAARKSLSRILFALLPLLISAVLPRNVLAAAQTEIGGWVLACPAAPSPSGRCLMRLRNRIFDKSGITGDLEVQAQGADLVPVITLRGLPAQVVLTAAMAGSAEASIQFAGHARQPMPCGASATGFICAPGPAAGPQLAAELPFARTAAISLTVTISGQKPLPAGHRILALSGTNQALRQLRAAGPAPVPFVMTNLSTHAPPGLMNMADKALRAAGYPNGVADIQGLLAKYLRK